MNKYKHLALIIGLMLVTIVATMVMSNTKTSPSTMVGGGMVGGARISYHTITASTTAVGPSTPALLSGADSSRLAADYINEGTSVVYLCMFSATCTTSNGQPLTQYGVGTIDDLNPYMGAVYAITASGTSTVSIKTIQ